MLRHFVIGQILFVAPLQIRNSYLGDVQEYGKLPPFFINQKRKYIFIYLNNFYAKNFGTIIMLPAFI